MPTERVTFPGHDGRALDGRLERPDGEAVAYALFAHCFTCGKDSLAASRVARALAAEGIATLRFDFTGLDEDGGWPEPQGLTGDVEDLKRAAAFLAEHARAPELLIGHSLGGAAVLAAAPALPSVVGAVTLNAPMEAAHVVRQFAGAVARIEAEGEASVTLGGRPVVLTRAFLHDVQAHEQAQRLRQLRCALLVMHAPDDETVPLAEAGEIFAAARHPKSFVALEGADHLLTRAEDAAYVARVIAAWASRYLRPIGHD